MEKAHRALERNRRLQRKREDNKQWLQPYSVRQAKPTPWTSAQRASKPHRSARALMRTCLAKGTMATCTDVPSVYLGRGSRSRKLARKPSVSPLLSLQQDVSLRRARGAWQAWMELLDQYGQMDAEEPEDTASCEPCADCTTVPKALEAIRGERGRGGRAHAMLCALERLMADLGNVALLVEMEGVPLLLDRLCGEDAAVVKVVSELLAILIYKSAAGRAQVLAAAGVELLLAAMQRHSLWEVQENCCKALKELAAKEAAAREQLQESGLQTILTAMKNHLSNARVQVVACGVLRNTSARSGKYQAQLASLGAGQLVIQAMAFHSKDPTVQCACCWALFCLCVQKCHLQQDLARQGAVHATLSAMTMPDPKVQEAGCWVLRELATTITSNVQLWLEMVQAVSNAMRDYDEPAVQKAGLTARQRLAQRGFKMTQTQQSQLVRTSILKRRRSLGPALSPIPE
ncbi:unnamed protein product [Effrenium voratum]|nr:unnamed protein product [Effrenium voratum]